MLRLHSELQLLRGFEEVLVAHAPWRLPPHDPGSRAQEDQRLMQNLNQARQLKAK
jgi:hypothetical protein